MQQLYFRIGVCWWTWRSQWMGRCLVKSTWLQECHDRGMHYLLLPSKPLDWWMYRNVWIRVYLYFFLHEKDLCYRRLCHKISFRFHLCFLRRQQLEDVNFIPCLCPCDMTHNAGCSVPIQSPLLSHPPSDFFHANIRVLQVGDIS